MKKLIELVYKYGKLKYAIPVILVGICLQVALFRNFLPDYLNYSDGIKNPDQLFTYNFQYISNLYQKLGTKGIGSYASMLYMDFAYLSVSALGWSLLLAALVRKKKWYITLPLFMAFFDIGENTMQLIFMQQFPSISSFGVQISSTFSSLKMVSAIVGVLLILFFAVKNIFIWSNNRKTIKLQRSQKKE